MNSLKHADHCDPELWIQQSDIWTKVTRNSREKKIMNPDKLRKWHIWLHNKIRGVMDIVVHTFVLSGYTSLLKEYNGITIRPRSYHANPIN